MASSPHATSGGRGQPARRGSVDAGGQHRSLTPMLGAGARRHHRHREHTGAGHRGDGVPAPLTARRFARSNRLALHSVVKEPNPAGGPRKLRREPHSPPFTSHSPPETSRFPSIASRSLHVPRREGLATRRSPPFTPRNGRGTPRSPLRTPSDKGGTGRDDPVPLRAYQGTERDERGTSYSPWGTPRSPSFPLHSPGGTRRDLRGMRREEHVSCSQAPLPPSRQPPYLSHRA